jgi:hypothetical protein
MKDLRSPTYSSAFCEKSKLHRDPSSKILEGANDRDSTFLDNPSVLQIPEEHHWRFGMRLTSSVAMGTSVSEAAQGCLPIGACRNQPAANQAMAFWT